MGAHTHVHTHTNTHTHAHTRTHMHAHTHAHAQKLLFNFRSPALFRHINLYWSLWMTFILFQGHGGRVPQKKQQLKPYVPSSTISVMNLGGCSRRDWSINAASSLSKRAQLWKRTKKMYSPVDGDERKDKKQPTVLTIDCLCQVNKNKLTPTTDREGRRKKQWRRGQTVLGRGNCDMNAEVCYFLLLLLPFFLYLYVLLLLLFF